MNMMITHICSAALIFWPIYEDLREQKISVFPAMGFIVVGVLAKLANMDDSAVIWLSGAVPGIAVFLAGPLFGKCIGAGDSLLIVGAGLMEGVQFCCRMLAVTGCGIFIFSMGMMAVGRLRRKSKVACVPFLALGYVGAWFL